MVLPLPGEAVSRLAGSAAAFSSEAKQFKKMKTALHPMPIISSYSIHYAHQFHRNAHVIFVSLVSRSFVLLVLEGSIVWMKKIL